MKRIDIADTKQTLSLAVSTALMKAVESGLDTAIAARIASDNIVQHLQSNSSEAMLLEWDELVRNGGLIGSIPQLVESVSTDTVPFEEINSELAFVEKPAVLNQTGYSGELITIEIPLWGSQVSSIGPAPSGNPTGPYRINEYEYWQGVFIEDNTLTVVAEGNVVDRYPYNSHLQSPTDCFDTIMASCCQRHLDERGQQRLGVEFGFDLLYDNKIRAFWVTSAMRTDLSIDWWIERMHRLKLTGVDWFKDNKGNFCFVREPKKLIEDWLPWEKTLQDFEAKNKAYPLAKNSFSRLLYNTQKLWVIEALLHYGGFDKGLGEAIFTGMLTGLPLGFIAPLYDETPELMEES